MKTVIPQYTRQWKWFLTPAYNLVDYLLSPANITEVQMASAQSIALEVVNALNSPGIFAVEMFIDITGKILVNELLPARITAATRALKATTAASTICRCGCCRIFH